MSDAPERIWAWIFTGQRSQGAWSASAVSYADSAYIRADVVERLIAERDALAGALQAVAGYMGDVGPDRRAYDEHDVEELERLASAALAKLEHQDG